MGITFYMSSVEKSIMSEDQLTFSELEQCISYKPARFYKSLLGYVWELIPGLGWFLWNGREFELVKNPL